MSDIGSVIRQFAAQLNEEYADLVISTKEERKAVTAMRPYLLPVLRERQDNSCWFCEEPLPDLNHEVDVHHVIPLHIVFPHGYGRPSSADDLRLVHRACHKRQEPGVR